MSQLDGGFVAGACSVHVKIELQTISPFIERQFWVSFATCLQLTIAYVNAGEK